MNWHDDDDDVACCAKIFGTVDYDAIECSVLKCTHRVLISTSNDGPDEESLSIASIESVQRTVQLKYHPKSRVS